MAAAAEEIEEQELEGRNGDESEEFNSDDAEGEGEDGDEDDDDDEDSDDESESSFDEMSVGVALELPKRQNRGKKYTQLVGEELEKDQQFWGHNTWEEEAVDEDYNCSEGEEQYAYSTDSDFDDPETDKSDEEVDESQFKEKKKRRYGSYVDPALQRNKLVRKTIDKQNTEKSRGDEGGRTRRQSQQAPEPGVSRSVRASTKWKTEITNEMERIRGSSKPAGGAAAQKKAPKKRSSMTQEQLMANALKTEAANARSLANLQAWEDEKKYYEDIKKWNYKGSYDIWVCWNSLLSIVTKNETEQEVQPTPPTHVTEKPLKLYMFTSGKLPEFYNEQEKARKRRDSAKQPLCAITGKPARYVDPLTGHYYSNEDAYNAIRMGHADRENRRMAAELDQFEDMLETLYDID
ncbi:YL1 nuclear C-terminal domain-containing protein [Babesia ovata]|uniref:YL1 nuclear C-terminal domain-containing protein n=1 Tax=Babesia ovata TaxID=189622 RepID=A0A2H6KFN8_9APIC|nr:YL1 nuclear C-terminal domain-containing protein [Babesia ovata]GBE61805.1 YL1 nuclear C-terminal domain-containing protein [Babesia ovata]